MTEQCPSGTPAPPGVAVTVPDPDAPVSLSCAGPGCDCQHPVPKGRSWCCERCRDRHRDRRERRQSPDKRDRRGRKRAPQRKTRRVAGVDGESITYPEADEGRGTFVLLTVATDDGDEWRVENPSGLSTTECFEFLTSLPKGIVYWGFAFRYDVNMMLRDVPPHIVERLQIEGECYWGPWRIDYKGKKLTISKRRRVSRDRKVTVATFTLWDMFPWVQTSFVKWLRKWELAPERTVARIDKMKNLRDSFNPTQRAAIRKYNREECVLLAKGARKLMELIDQTGLPIRAYNSPASVAKAAMDKYKVADFRTDPPAHLTKTIEKAYHGGRAELAIVGPVEGPIYSYDLNSAYPATTVDLPCLVCGSWAHHPDGFDPIACADFYGTEWTLFRVSWRERQGKVWGPFPVNPSVGSKKYPTSGTGWYWGPEVVAAIRRGYHVTVKEAWEYIPGCHDKPFSYLTDLYELRKQLQGIGDDSQIIYKLALNSTYGSLAEHPHVRRGELSIPRHRNMMWAGLVTSRVRAQLLDVLDDDVLFLATDCAMSYKPLDVNIGDELGAWGHDPDHDVLDRMLIFGTGQYFKSVGGEWVKAFKSRGFDPRDISREALDRLWIDVGREGVYTFRRKRFVGYGTALRRISGMWPPDFRLWRTFVTETVAKRFDMTPRRVWLSDDVHDGRTVAPSMTLVRETERRDKAALAEYRANYDEAMGWLAKLDGKTTPTGKPSALAERRRRQWQERAWKMALAITGMSGSPESDDGRLFPMDAEPVAWGDDF